MRFTGWTALSLAVLLLGVAFWLYMGATFGSWTDVGVYSLGITMVAFGAIGAWVSLAEARAA